MSWHYDNKRPFFKCCFLDFMICSSCISSQISSHIFSRTLLVFFPPFSISLREERFKMITNNWTSKCSHLTFKLLLDLVFWNAIVDEPLSCLRYVTIYIRQTFFVPFSSFVEQSLNCWVPPLWTSFLCCQPYRAFCHTVCLKNYQILFFLKNKYRLF